MDKGKFEFIIVFHSINQFLIVSVDLNQAAEAALQDQKYWEYFIMLTLTRRFKHRLLVRQLQGMSPFQEMIISHIKKTTALTSVPRHY